MIGGTVLGNIPRTWTREQWYDGEGVDTPLGRDAFRRTMTETPGNFVVIKDAYVEDFEDAYDPNSPAAEYTTYLVPRPREVHPRRLRRERGRAAQPGDPRQLLRRLLRRLRPTPGGREHRTQRRRARSPSPSTSSLVHVVPQRLGPEYCDDDRVEQGRCRPTEDGGRVARGLRHLEVE